MKIILLFISMIVSAIIAIDTLANGSDNNIVDIVGVFC